MVSIMFLGSVVVALALPMTSGQEKPLDQEPSVEFSRELAEDLAMLEAMLRVRDTRITEARRQVDFERDLLDALRARQEAGGIPARMVEESEARFVGAEALVEARQADRDELAIRIAQVRRFAAAPSPEPDVDEQRARLDDDVRIREAQVRAREARLRAAEAQVASEESKLAQFRDSVQRGTEGPGRIRQATHRVAEATAWRDTMIAERDVARLLLDRAQRRRAQFDDPEATDPTLGRSGQEDLAVRVQALESLVDTLRDEVYQVNWELQGIRNRLP